jgi:hypothetical protein
MKTTWFKKTKWAYIPISPFGYLVSLLAIAFLIPVAAAILRNGHSVSDDMYQFFVYASCTVFWWKWIAEKSCA